MKNQDLSVFSAAKRRLVEAKAIILEISAGGVAAAAAYEELMQVPDLLRLNIVDGNDALDIDEVSVSNSLLEQADPSLSADGYKSNRHLLAFDAAEEALKDAVRYMKRAAHICAVDDSVETLEQVMTDLAVKIDAVNTWTERAHLLGVSEAFCQVSRVHPQFVQTLAKLSVLMNETNGSPVLRLA